MAIQFPEELDSFLNPQPTDSVAIVSHAEQHSNANDAIEALEAKVGTDNSLVSTSHDYRIRQLELNPVTGTASKIEQIVVNNTGSTLLKGQVVYASGSVGASGKLRVSLSSNSTESGSSKTFGVLAENIINGGEGILVTEGLLEGVDTTGAADGDPVWLGPTAGSKIFGLTEKPSAPAHLVFLGIVVRGGNANNGSIFVKIQNGFELEELHNVSIATLSDNQVLRYDASTQLWKNETIDDLFDPAGAAATAQSNAEDYTDTAIAGLGNDIEAGYIPVTEKATAGGVASLDLSGKVPDTQLDIDSTIQNVASSMITGGTHTNISTSFDNVTKKLSFSTTPLTQEQIQDFVAPLLNHSQHTNITATYDDDNNRIVLQGSSSSGGGASVTISPTAPTSPTLGNIWLDSDNGSTFIWDGVYWVEIGGAGTAEAIAAVASSAPANPILGRIWLNSSTAKTYIYDGSYWVEI